MEGTGDKEEKQIRKHFAKFGTFPKILIVTEKLLTGYDAPLLYAMYLDKPMRDHTLLHAIARVNRPPPLRALEQVDLVIMNMAKASIARLNDL